MMARDPRALPRRGAGAPGGVGGAARQRAARCRGAAAGTGRRA
jgi:hypothetical protein